MCFLTDFLSGWSVYWCKWGVEVPYYSCVTVDFSFYIMLIFVIYWGAPMLGACIFIILYLLTMLIPWLLCSVLFWSPVTVFALSLFLSRSISSDLSISIQAFFWFPFVEYVFQSPHFQFVCFSSSEARLL